MDETDVAHLAGFFDAAGVLTVHVSKDDDYALGYIYEPVCRVTCPANERDALIGKLTAFCDNEFISYGLSEESHSGDRDGHSYRFEIKRTEDMQKFLKTLAPHLVSKYDQAGIMLEQVLPRIEDKLHLEKEGFYELMNWADKLRAYSNHTSRTKYDQEFFAEEWSFPQ